MLDPGVATNTCPYAAMLARCSFFLALREVTDSICTSGSSLNLNVSSCNRYGLRAECTNNAGGLLINAILEVAFVLVVPHVRGVLLTLAKEGSSQAVARINVGRSFGNLSSGTFLLNSIPC